MPSPLGHALAGAAAGWAIAPPRTRTQVWRTGAAFAALGMLPDLDLLGSLHRGPTHSLGAAVIVGVVAAIVTRHPRLGLAAAAAYATHTLLDWLSADTSTPLGIMAFWPLTREYYQASTSVFDSVWRRHETPDFWAHNIRAVAKEVCILAPPCLVAWIFRTRRTAGASRLHEGSKTRGARSH